MPLQVLPNRTHPTMQTHGASGFVLVAVTVVNQFTAKLLKPNSGAKRDRPAPASSTPPEKVPTAKRARLDGSE